MSDPSNVRLKEVETCNYCAAEFCSAGDIEPHQIYKGESYCDDCIDDAKDDTPEESE